MSTTIEAVSGSPHEFLMPSLGADMKFGTLVNWRVAPGDRVSRGDVVAEVETEKGVFEVEIQNDGVIAELVVAKGTKVPVGSVLARLRTEAPAAVPVAAPVAAAVAAAVAAPVATPVTTAVAVPPSPKTARVRVSPLARRVAAASGVDLSTVVGTGSGGVITRADVIRVSHAAVAPLLVEEPLQGPPPAEAPPAVLMPPPAPPAAHADAMRHAVAAAVSKSKREIPHYYLSTDVDLSAAFAWLSATNAQRAVSERILPAALLLKSVATALRRYPDLNGFWVEDRHRPSEHIHLGIAVSLRTGGLIAPAIHDADRLTVDALMHALTDVVGRARSGGLRSSEIIDATVTVSNLGDEGVPVLFGVIYPPQLALVGFGKITERAWATHGMIGARPVVTATLSADHRATDGHYGARFLAEVDHLLQSPETL